MIEVLTRLLFFTLADILAALILGTWPQWGAAERAWSDS